MNICIFTVTRQIYHNMDTWANLNYAPEMIWKNFVDNIKKEMIPLTDLQKFTSRNLYLLVKQILSYLGLTVTNFALRNGFNVHSAELIFNQMISGYGEPRTFLTQIIQNTISHGISRLPNNILIYETIVESPPEFPKYFKLQIDPLVINYEAGVPYASFLTFVTYLSFRKIKSLLLIDISKTKDILKNYEMALSLYKKKSVEYVIIFGTLEIFHNYMADINQINNKYLLINNSMWTKHFICATLTDCRRDIFQLLSRININEMSVYIYCPESKQEERKSPTPSRISSKRRLNINGSDNDLCRDLNSILEESLSNRSGSNSSLNLSGNGSNPSSPEIEKQENGKYTKEISVRPEKYNNFAGVNSEKYNTFSDINLEKTISDTYSNTETCDWLLAYGLAIRTLKLVRSEVLIPLNIEIINICKDGYVTLFGSALNNKARKIYYNTEKLNISFKVKKFFSDLAGNIEKCYYGSLQTVFEKYIRDKEIEILNQQGILDYLYKINSQVLRKIFCGEFNTKDEEFICNFCNSFGLNIKMFQDFLENKTSYFEACEVIRFSLLTQIE